MKKKEMKKVKVMEENEKKRDEEKNLSINRK